MRALAERVPGLTGRVPGLADRVPGLAEVAVADTASSSPDDEPKALAS